MNLVILKKITNFLIRKQCRTLAPEVRKTDIPGMCDIATTSPHREKTWVFLEVYDLRMQRQANDCVYPLTNIFICVIIFLSGGTTT